MNSKITNIFKKTSVLHLLVFFFLFSLIIFATIKTHSKLENRYDLSIEKNLLQRNLDPEESNELRFLLISKITDLPKHLFKSNLPNITTNLINLPESILVFLNSTNLHQSFNLNLNNLKLNFLSKISLDDVVINPAENKANIYLKIEKLELTSDFELCSQSTDCAKGKYKEIYQNSLIILSSEIYIHKKIFLKNLIISLNHEDEKVLVNLNSNENVFINRIFSEFIKSNINEKVEKNIHLHVEKAFNNIYSDIIYEENLSKISNDQSWSKKDHKLADNKTSIEFLKKLINLPSTFSNIFTNFLDQQINKKSLDNAKITFYNQNIESILKTNLSNLQNLKKKYFDTLKNNFETSSKNLNLQTIAEPFVELFENQFKETIENKIEYFLNNFKNSLNNQLNDKNQQNFKNDEDLDDESSVDDIFKIEPNDNENSSFKEDEIIDDYTQTVRSSRVKRQVPCQRGQELDEYVDSLFRFASRLIRAMEPVSLPNATIDLPEFNMKLFLHHGGATRAHTLSRKRPAWVYCTNESVSLGLTLGFDDVRVKYQYRAIKDWGLLWDGELEAKLEHTKLQVQFTQTTPEEDSDVQVMQRIDRIRIWRLGHVRVMLKGLGNLTQAVSMILNRMLNQNMDTLGPTLRYLESEVVSIGNNLLKNVSIPFFSII